MLRRCRTDLHTRFRIGLTEINGVEDSTGQPGRPRTSVFPGLRRRVGFGGD